MGYVPPRMGALISTEGFFLYVACRHRKAWQAVAKLAARHRTGSQARTGEPKRCGAESAFHHIWKERQLQTARIALLSLPSSSRDHKAFDSGQANAYYIVKLTVGSVMTLAAVQRRLDAHATHQSTVMTTNALLPDDRDDDFEPLPPSRFADYDTFVAQWEEEGQHTRRRLLRLGLSQAAKGACLDLEFDHWLVEDRQWTKSLISLHKLCQEFQIASPLDGKVYLQTETATRWVERDAYVQNPHQWDSDGQVWVAQPSDCNLHRV